MKILTEDMRNGKYNGLIVWVTVYNRPDLHKKPLRCIYPTKCLICSNDKLPENHKIYYSDSHFVKLGKNDKPTKNIINPVDNTGYRYRIGNELHIFTDQNECYDFWNSLLDEYINKLEEYKVYQTEIIENEITKLNNNKIY